MTDLREKLIAHHELWVSEGRESAHEDAVKFHTDALEYLRALSAQPALAVPEGWVRRISGLSRKWRDSASRDKRNDRKAATIRCASELEKLAVSLTTAPQPGCTCPSGDGSLRHPCPEHPAQPEADPLADENLPGMWERADLIGGETDDSRAVPEAKAGAARKYAYYETHDPPHCPTCECGMNKLAAKAGADDWTREAVEVLRNVAAELDATGRHSQRIARVIESVPKPAEGGAVDESTTLWMDEASRLLGDAGHNVHAAALATLAEGIRRGRVVSAPAGSGEAVAPESLAAFLLENVRSFNAPNKINVDRFPLDLEMACECLGPLYTRTPGADADAIERLANAVQVEAEGLFREGNTWLAQLKRASSDELYKLAKRLTGAEGGG